MPRDPFLDQSQDSGGPQMPSLREGQWLFNRRYELKKLLGAGGMGVVWLARDQTEEIDVALKFLPSLLVLQEREMQRLREEVRAGKELRHPRLVATYGMELEDGIAAIVMEYVPGQTLREKLDDAPRGFFETAEIQPWVADICTALDYLHEEAKRIHRDLKPANVMLDAGDRVKLMDFGISHRIKESVSRHSKTDEAASGAGGSSSTLAYASPQQISGKPSDKADDIYSLGAMLYELLTGTPPFFRGGLEAVGFQIKTEPVTPLMERRQELVTDGLNASVGEAVPPNIEKVILDSLEKDREKRPKSASKVAQSFSSSPRANTPSAPLTRSTDSDVGVQPLGDPTNPATEGSSTSLSQPSPYRLKPQATAAAPSKVAQSFSSSPRANTPAPAPSNWQQLFEQRAEWSGDGTSEKSRPRRKALHRPPSVRGTVLYYLTVAVSLLIVIWVIFPPKKRGSIFSGSTNTVQMPQAAANSTNPLDDGQLNSPIEIPLPANEKMSLCFCPAGSFTMGSPASEEGHMEVEEQVSVTLTQRFWMARTELTQGQWVALMGSNPSSFKGDDLPVENVSWEDADAFIRVLNEKVPLEGWRWVLPTEAQWEYACRAGSAGEWGWVSTNQMGTLEATGWFDENAGASTHEVGTKKANAWGLCDMHGNVWEWCRDAWDGSLKLPGGTNPIGTTGSFRVYRGGSWDYYAQYCRAANRFRYIASIRGNYLGFRPAAVPAGAE